MNNNFIDRDYILSLLEKAGTADDSVINSALKKAELGEKLEHSEIAALLKTENTEHISRIFDIAGKIKKRIYGNRIVIFAPLYVSDYCENRCAYCSFNASHNFARSKLTMKELREEVKILEKNGHKRLALEAGESKNECSIDYILECIKTIYDMKFENGEIRRINVNIAATTTDNYKRLKNAGIGTYILFQETYDEQAYNKVHLAGPKKDFLWHLNAFDRAQAAGIDDVGGGVLFGLADPYFDVMGLVIHNEHLEKNYNTGFHTISVPRLCNAEGSFINDLDSSFKPVSDEIFTKIVAVIRIAVPFTGMILSTRESSTLRKKLLQLGISQISAGSRTEVGGYSKLNNKPANPQFLVNDERDAFSIISELIDDGFIPSFCTACYREGRTGDRFMSLAKSGEIKNVCLPNALMTLSEFSMDYGDETFRKKASGIIQKEIPNIANDSIRKKTIENIEKIQNSMERDFFV
ncbi:MAG: [FeFe] hydrogenase H-cluster radical SAM maturase HydG [Treponema sp.]|nr:[FeFe] hydrogenase H-cluster radical SAM maturase HydG [Treponema sp.]